MKSGRRVPFNPNKNRRRQWEPCRSSSSMGAGNNSRIDADDVQPAQTSQTTDTLPLIGTASRSTLTRPTCWLVRRSWRSASSCGDEIRLRSEGPSPRQIGSAPASLSDITPWRQQRASGRALPHDYQREQAGAKQSDARERNRQESKRCEFLTHGCVAKDSPRSDHHKSGDAQSRAAQNDDWRD